MDTFFAINRLQASKENEVHITNPSHQMKWPSVLKKEHLQWLASQININEMLETLGYPPVDAKIYM